MENEQQTNPIPDQQSGSEQTWTAEENQFTHMSDEEKKRHLGWNPAPDEMKEREEQSARNAPESSSGDQNS